MASTQFRQLSPGAKSYIAVAVVAGAATVTESAYRMYVNPIGWDWTVLALLTLVSGSATVRLPSLPVTLSVSETFVFTSTLLFGPASGTLIVALDALVISIWSYRKRQTLFKAVFNVCALPLPIWLASHAFFYFSGIRPLALSAAPEPLREWIWVLAALTLVYFLLSSWLITFAIALERGFPPFRIWRDNFVPLSLNYFGGASVAALLVSYRNAVDLTYLAVIVPLLIVLYFTYSLSMGRVEDANRHLTQLNRLYMSTIETLAMAIDAKDQITHGHIRRVQTYAVGLARAMGVTDANQVKAIEAAALLHDMGKLAVPEYILNKPGPLTPAEFEKMKLHASVGADILSAIEFPYPVVPIVRHHHECWDGSGYPDGLKSTDIPVGARILSVVDCFDALTSDRPYRPRLADKEAVRILVERRGTMYDPLVVDTFLTVHGELVGSVGPATSATFTAIASAVAPRAEYVTRTQPLEDIAASSDEMLTLFTLARELTGRMSVSDVADVLMKHLRRLVPASLCVFFIYEEEATDLVAAHVSGDNPEAVRGLRIPLGQRLSGWVGANRQTIRNSDPLLDFGESVRAMSPRLRSCLSTPLLSGDRLVGVLSLYSPPADGFSEDHQRLVEIVARQVSPVIQRSIEYASSALQAFRDPLTGLPNLQHLREFAGAQEHLAELPLPSSLIYVDVNNLKQINISQGRNAGDEALRQVVQQLRANLRAADVLFRLESDEFAVLLLQTESHTATAIASRMKASVERVTTTSVTVAVVAAPADGRRIDALVDSARRSFASHHAGTSRQNSNQPPSVH